MKFINAKRDDRDIEVGDIVVYEGRTCILAYVPDVTMDDIDYPYCIISLDSGRELNGFPNLKEATKDCILIAKNEDVTLTY